MVNATAESAAKVRVVVDFAVLGTGERDDGSAKRSPAKKPIPDHFSTIGVSENIVDASWQAITDAFTYYLLEIGAAG